MTSPYRKVLMIGATVGIGRGLAARLIKEGSHVIVTGRTTSKLKEFVQEHGSDKPSWTTFDIADAPSIPVFCDKIFGDHPDIDCVWINAGVQYPQPPLLGAWDATKTQQEVAINYTGQVLLAQAVLPRLQAQRQAALVFTSTSLAYLPFPMVAGYSATKAATHIYAMCLRDQLKREKSNVKVIEIYPPMVQTELHGEHGRHMGMPLQDFIDQAWPGIAGGHEHYVVGKSFAPDDFFDRVEMERMNTLSSALEKVQIPGQ